MKEYHKIQGLYKRDPSTNKFIEGEWSLPEFGYLAGLDWVWTEKVDGTNMRVMVKEMGPDDIGRRVTFGGKTDNAQLRGDLIENMIPMFPIEKMMEVFEGAPEGVCLYGEGYGPGIQKVGSQYRDDKSFVLFDVRVGHWWLKREDVYEIAKNLAIEPIPYIDTCPIVPMIERVREGIKSTWGDFISEGVVGTPLVPLAARSGERIITKIKTVDFV